MVLKKGIPNRHSFFLFISPFFFSFTLEKPHPHGCLQRQKVSVRWWTFIQMKHLFSPWALCARAQDEDGINMQQALRDYRCTSCLTVAFIIFHYSYYLYDALVGLPRYYSRIHQPPPSLNLSSGSGCRGVKACSVFKCDFQQCPGSGRWRGKSEIKCKALLSSVPPLLRFCLVSGCFLSLFCCDFCQSYFTDSAAGH